MNPPNENPARTGGADAEQLSDESLDRCEPASKGMCNCHTMSGSSGADTLL